MLKTSFNFSLIISKLLSDIVNQDKVDDKRSDE